jgi:hypothetical protein
MPLSAPLAALLLAAAPDAGVLGELQATLATLTARTPVAVHLTHHVETRSGEGKDATLVQGDVAGEVAESPQGLDLHWSGEVLGRAREEGRRRAVDPESPAPTQEAIAELDALHLGRRLDVASELRDVLGYATLVEDRPDTLDGAPARLLVLKLSPPLRARDRKYVSELDATARVWLGADGVPLGAERRVKTSGRAFLVITFESEDVETFRFAHVGDRLLVARHQGERHGSGAGEKSARKSATVLEVLKPVEARSAAGP